MMNEVDPQLILRYFEGTCSDVERQRIKKWVAANPKREDEIESLRQIWTTPAKQKVDVNIDSAWSAVAGKAGIAQATVEEKEPIKRNIFPLSILSGHSSFSNVVRAVAVILLLVGVSYVVNWYLSSAKEPQQLTTREIAAERGQRVRLLFGDGTKVVLNSASVLRFPEKFSGSSREVFLQGEAYFDVAYVEAAVFFVRTSDAVVQALGTGFSVRAWPDENKVEVVVARGKVAVRSEWAPNSTEVVLRQGQGSTVPHGQSPTEAREVDLDKMLAWTEGRLVFQRTPLRDALRQLGRRYDIGFDVKDSILLKKTLTASVKNESLTEVLNLVALSLNIRYEKKGSVVIFSGAGKK